MLTIDANFEYTRPCPRIRPSTNDITFYKCLLHNTNSFLRTILFMNSDLAQRAKAFSARQQCRRSQIRAPVRPGTFLCWKIYMCNCRSLLCWSIQNPFPGIHLSMKISIYTLLLCLANLTYMPIPTCHTCFSWWAVVCHPLDLSIWSDNRFISAYSLFKHQFVCTLQSLSSQLEKRYQTCFFVTFVLGGASFIFSLAAPYRYIVHSWKKLKGHQFFLKSSKSWL
jgi:hypothetical protein